MHHFKRVLFCVFFLSSVFGVGFSYAQCGGGMQVGDVVTPYWKGQNDQGVSIPNIKGLLFSPITYALINVVQGVEYEIYKIKAKDDTDKFLNFIKLCYENQNVALSANVSSPNEYKISFKAPISGQLKLYVRYVEITNLHIRIIGGQNTIDTPRDALPNENNRWRTYFYRETNNFVNYLGYKDYDDHWFHERRDPVTNSNPIEVRSQGAIRAGILRYFTARSVMRNTLLKGFYYVKLGADDGTRLFVNDNNNEVYNRWNPAGDYSVKTQVIKLTGNDKLKYEYFNDNIPLEYIFKIDPTTDKIIENTTLTSSNGTTLCMGRSTTLDGDDFAAALPNTFTNPTFQWYYDTNPTGNNKQPIGGNTRQYVVKADDFPQGGTFYFFREAKMIINNIGVSPKPESIISDPIKIDIIKQLSVSIDPPKELCKDAVNAQIRIKINNGRGGTPPFTFYYEVNDKPLQSNPSYNNIFHIPVNTSQAGTFQYKYLYVTDGNGCKVELGGSDNITINPLPTATFLEQNTTLCLNTSKAQVPWVTFTGKPPFTVRVKATKTGGTPKEKEYSLENNQNRLVIEHTPNDKGEFTYEILWVRDANGCTTHFTNKKKVVNVVAPSITAPENVVWCLPEITRAVYQSNGETTISENRYVLPKGDKALDVEKKGVPCCLTPILKWEIKDGSVSVQKGEGQPSKFAGTISLENNTTTDKIYTIYYWLECNGQSYSHDATRQIRITPRPQIHFSN
ncbi:hypothetical protein CAPN006_10620 [Capnocytophaga canimorsus]|uniref:hypothetical protein n=1 Tax=Capnocytophaga canimorsus TaxID=28188 RepID=UPI001ACB7665|nr:hypothetical protein [Capnocytophaga canimorsus]GIM56668.1 hypothetical protein CAPN006_10620 [Capnocytophaga canimorsus]